MYEQWKKSSERVGKQLLLYVVLYTSMTSDNLNVIICDKKCIFNVTWQHDRLHQIQYKHFEYSLMCWSYPNTGDTRLYLSDTLIILDYTIVEFCFENGYSSRISFIYFLVNWHKNISFFCGNVETNGKMLISNDNKRIFCIHHWFNWRFC